MCVGLKFLPKGQIENWGVAIFSYECKLLGEDETVRLTTQFSSEELYKITNQIKDNKNKTMQVKQNS